MTASISERARAKPPETDNQVSPPQFGRIVSNEDVDKALSWLRDSAIEIGRARERLVKAGHMVKHVEAILSLASDERSVEARKADARCKDKWIDAINEEAIAAGEFEKLKALREAATAKVDAWRTESATWRSMKL